MRLEEVNLPSPAANFQILGADPHLCGRQGPGFRSPSRTFYSIIAMVVIIIIMCGKYICVIAYI